MTRAGRLSTLVAAAVIAAGGVAGMTATSAQAQTAPTSCLPEARACVNLTTQQAWLAYDGMLQYGPVPVRTGKASAPTDPGTFRVTYKDQYHRSREFNNAPMPYSVFFNGGDALHEGSLAVPSNGCVHLTPTAARTFFAVLNVGDVVQVVR